MEETRAQRAKEFSYRMCTLPLADCNVSIRAHARNMNLRPNTYADWMNGSENTPFIWDVHKSFALLGLNPMWYYGSYFHPEVREIDRDANPEALRTAVQLFLVDTTEEEILLLHHLRFSMGKSRWHHLLQICVADAHLPMDDRVKSTEYLTHMYKYTDIRNLSLCDDVKPNVELVKSASVIGKTAVIHGKSGYVGIPTTKEFFVGKIGHLLSFCREKGGVTKEYMAYINGCRVETISNYEAEVSYPNCFKLAELIRSTGLNPFQLVYGEMFPHPANIPSIGKTSKERSDLIDAARTDPEDEITWLLFLILGQHGGSWHCYLHKMAMLASLPDETQEQFDNFVAITYEMDSVLGRTVCNGKADPGIDSLKRPTQ